MAAHHCSLFESAGGHDGSRAHGPIDLSDLSALPGIWRTVISERAGAALLGRRGARMLVLAPGSLIWGARAFAALREEHQWGATDVFAADEPRVWRDWDEVLALSFAGDEPELLHALRHLPPRVLRRAATIAGADVLGALVDDVVDLPCGGAPSLLALETALLLAAREALGDTLDPLPASLDAMLASNTPESAPGYARVAVLGSGWLAPLAVQAALELAGAPAMPAEAHAPRDIRYGALDHAGQESLLWFLDPAARDIRERALATGATLTGGQRDPLVEFVAIHRMARELASERSAA